MSLCECRNWGRESSVFLTEHHRNCQDYNGEGEARKHIEALLAGILLWAGDEDGIHYECFNAFRDAARFIGRTDLIKDMIDD